MRVAVCVINMLGRQVDQERDNDGAGGTGTQHPGDEPGTRECADHLMAMWCLWDGHAIMGPGWVQR